MNKKKLKIAIWTIYFISMFIYSFIGLKIIPDAIQEYMDNGGVAGPSIIFACIITPGIYHFFTMIGISIVISCIKMIDEEYKKTIYCLTIVSLILIPCFTGFVGRLIL